MSQHDMDILNAANAALRADLNLALKALASQSSGAADPATQYAYQRKARTDLGVMMRRNAANTGNILDGTLAETLLIARAANTVLAIGDFARIIAATGSWTQTFNAAATLGDGWFVEYRNDGTGVITLDPNAAETIDGAATIQLAPSETCCIYCDGTQFKTIGRRTTDIAATSINGGQIGGFHNKLINSDFMISQLVGSGANTVVAGANLVYTIDQWYSFCAGANSTAQRVAGTGQDEYAYQFTGAASVTGIGFGQRMESINTFHLGGASAILGIDLSNSLLTSVGWALYYATSNDTFGTIAAPTRTLISSGTFTVTASKVRYFTPAIAIPGAATTGLELVLTVGAQTSGTWTIGKPQLEQCSVSATVGSSFERVSYQDQLRWCQRYLEKTYDDTANPASATYGGAITIGAATTNSATASPMWLYKTSKRVVPTITLYSPVTGAAANCRNIDVAADVAAVTFNSGLNSVQLVPNAATVVNHRYAFHATADARM